MGDYGNYERSSSDPSQYQSVNPTTSSSDANASRPVQGKKGGSSDTTKKTNVISKLAGRVRNLFRKASKEGVDVGRFKDPRGDSQVSEDPYGPLPRLPEEDGYGGHYAALPTDKQLENTIGPWVEQTGGESVGAAGEGEDPYGDLPVTEENATSTNPTWVPATPSKMGPTLAEVESGEAADSREEATTTEKAPSAPNRFMQQARRVGDFVSKLFTRTPTEQEVEQPETKIPTKSMDAIWADMNRGTAQQAAEMLGDAPKTDTAEAESEVSQATNPFKDTSSTQLSKELVKLAKKNYAELQPEQKNQLKNLIAEAKDRSLIDSRSIIMLRAKMSVEEAGKAVEKALGKDIAELLSVLPKLGKMQDRVEESEVDVETRGPVRMIDSAADAWAEMSHAEGVEYFTASTQEMQAGQALVSASQASVNILREIQHDGRKVNEPLPEASIRAWLTAVKGVPEFEAAAADVEQALGGTWGSPALATSRLFFHLKPYIAEGSTRAMIAKYDEAEKDLDAMSATFTREDVQQWLNATDSVPEYQEDRRQLLDSLDGDDQTLGMMFYITISQIAERRQT